MSRLFHIGLNDIRLVFRDKSSYFWLFAMPLAFAYFMSFTSRAPSEAENARPEIYVENLDTGFLSLLFLETLGQEGVRPVGEDRKEDAKRGITIPVDFTDSILSKKQSVFEAYKMEGIDDARSMLVEVSLFRAAVAFNGYLVEHATAYGADMPIVEEALKEVMLRDNPVRLEARFAGRKPIPVGMNQSLPGNLVTYLLLNLMVFGGASIANERRAGILRRLSISPIGRVELLGGKLFGLMLLACVQIAVFMILGQFAFGVNMGDQAPAIALLLLVFSWVGASSGLLIGFLIKSEEKVVGLSLMIALPMGAMGGDLLPVNRAI
ncbi:hypothetical protein VDG1235_301 [Verrucomicrobiia bacterium DG1235]|nr:hypothetical protein VDG1235_301 [Verrucomicrobiae bacterium DG1235]